jgi:deoxyribodipyrimidine photolyase-related protein
VREPEGVAAPPPGAEADVDTVWVLGDQLNRGLAHLREADPAATRVLLVLSRGKLRSRRWHRQRAHLIVTAMRRFAVELEEAGFAVDWREAETFRHGFRAHVDEHDPGTVRAMEPANLAGRRLLEDLGVELVRSDQFLCHYDDFAAWADQHERPDGSLVMEDFYRWQRRRLDVLMDGDEPTGGRWNLDHENREPPPADGGEWPDAVTSRLDELDREVMDQLDAMEGVELFGAPPDGTWATSRRRALARLDRFVDEVLPGFGPYEDAVVSHHWHLNHSLLSHALNLGLLHPREVVERAEAAYREGRAPLASVEGLVRQVIGWREFVWGVYWRWMPGYADANELGYDRPLPPALTGEAATGMSCVRQVVGWVDRHAYAHHIPRLMVLANLATLAGVRPAEVTDWMWRSFVDGAEWVMVPNVVGMGMYADGGRMSTKPYVSGGNYLSRMTDLCDDCRFSPRRRTGEDACPFTTLYWDYLARHQDRLRGNHRLARPYATLDRLSDLDAVRERAAEVLERLDAGTL